MHFSTGHNVMWHDMTQISYNELWLFPMRTLMAFPARSHSLYSRFLYSPAFSALIHHFLERKGSNSHVMLKECIKIWLWFETLCRVLKKQHMRNGDEYKELAAVVKWVSCSEGFFPSRSSVSKLTRRVVVVAAIGNEACMHLLL